MTSIDPKIAECLASTASPWGSSRFAEYRRCQRAHDLRYGSRRVQPKDSPGYFMIGRLVHSALQYMQLGVMADEPKPRDWLQLLEVASNAPDTPPEVVGEVERLLSAYFAHYGEANAGWPAEAEIIAVELLHEDQLGPLPYTARSDTLLKLAGEFVIADTKTRGRGITDPSYYAESLSARPQFLGLSWLVQREFDLSDPPPVWVNAIIKTKIPKLQRIMVRFSQEQIDRWAKAQADQSYDLKTTVEHSIEREPLANYSECAPEIGRRCWAYDWCHGSDESKALHYRTEESETDE